MEVLTAPSLTPIAKAVTLAYAPHPFALDRRLTPVDAGLTVKQACLQSGVDPNQPIVIFLNGELLPVSDWTKPLAHGDFLTVQAEVEGGGGGGSNPLQVVAMIALTYFTMGAGAALWMPAGMAGTFAGFALSGAAFMAGSMVINSVFPVATPSTNFNGGAYEQPSPTYSLSGGSNRMRPYESMPLVMGTHRIFPDATMKPYTEYQGQDQYLYQSFNAGIVPATLTDFKIGTTPINTFSDVRLTVGGTDSFPKNVDTQRGFTLTSSAGWVARTGSTYCYQMAIDIEAILFYSNDSGSIDWNECELNLEYRPVGGAWLPFSEGFRKGAVYREECDTSSGYDENGMYYESSGCSMVLVSAADTGNKSTIGNNSQKPLRLTYLFKPATVGQYEVRVRKVTADSTDSRRQNTVNVAAIRSYQIDNSSYAGQNRITLTIKASDQLNGAVAQLSCLAQAKAQVWSGSAWVEQATSNPAHWFMDFCKGRTVNGRLAYGLGLTNAQIDFTSLLAWANFCSSEALTFNAVIDGNKTAADVLNMIGRAGFGSPSWASGKLGVVWDGRMQPPVAVFGMANIIKGSFNVSYLTEQLADEFIVSYVDPSDDYNQSQVRVAVQGVTTPTNSTNIDLMGCTSKAMAGKFANYLAAQQKYRRRKVTWETDMEGFVCQRGDVVLLSHDLTQWGYSGRVLAISGSTITLDRSVTSSNGNYLMVRHSNGSMTTHTTSTVGDASVLTVSPSVTDANPLDCVYTFSPLATQGKRVKITSIQPINNNRLRIIATDDDAEFYAAWDGAFNEVVKQTLLSNATPSISNLNATESLAYVGGFVVSQVSVGMQWSANVERVQLKWRMNSGDWSSATLTTSNHLINLGNAYGKLELSAVPIGNSMIQGDAQNLTMPIYGKSLPPAPVVGFNVINSSGNGLASWDIHPDLDVRVNGRFEIRHTTEAAPTWEKSYWLLDVAGSATSAIVPVVNGTYLIRAIDDTGNMGNVSTFTATEASLTGFNTLATISGFNGTQTNTVVDLTTGLKLANNTLFDSIAAIDSLSEPLDNVGGIVLTGELIHSDSFNFGSLKTVQIQVLPTVLAYQVNDLIDNVVDFDQLASLEASSPTGCDALFYVSTSQTDSGTDWTAYTPFIKGEFKAWRAKFKTALSVNSPNSNISVTSLTITAKEKI